jgi:hypothetical protein
MHDGPRQLRALAAELAGTARRGVNNPHLYQYLGWKYGGVPLLRRQRHLYPVAVFLPAEEQIGDVDSVLLDLQDTSPEDYQLEPRDATFRQLWDQTLRRGHLQDLPTYTMKRLTASEDRLGIVCERGSYFRAVETCDALEWEAVTSAATELNDSSKEAFERFDATLPLRCRLHAIVDDPITDGRHRSAAIAVSTLVAFNDEGQYYLLLSRRAGEGVTAYRGLLHVVPSFMFQPVAGHYREEWSIRHNIYREYLEELFDRPEPQGGMTAWRQFYVDPCLVYLRDLEERGDARLYLTGIAVNLLNLRPEICTVLLIRSPEWFRHHTQLGGPRERFRLNAEWASPAGSADRGISRLALATSDDAQLQADNLGPTAFLPPGAAAFWLGISLVRELLADRA